MVQYPWELDVDLQSQELWIALFYQGGRKVGCKDRRMQSLHLEKHDGDTQGIQMWLLLRLSISLRFYEIPLQFIMNSPC